MNRILLTSLLLTLIAACSSQTATPPPTVTSIPTYAYTTPTQVAIIGTLAAATDAVTQQVAADPTDIAHGENRYTVLGCAACHGADGKGNGSKGPALVPMTLSEDDFLNVLRTGGKLGSAHLFASNRISDDFANYLYLYLKSLPS